MPHLIETYVNSGRGDFLIDHWLRSLRDNVDLRDIDILVTDYGMTAEQVRRLREQGVIVRPGELIGRMSNVHYRDLAAFLRKRDYDQVLYCDCGDVIFQADIRPIFEENKETFRAAREEVFNWRLHQLTLGLGDVRPEALPEIKRVLRGKATINGGFVLGPAAKMGGFWEEYCKLCRGQDRHGTDQLIMSYLMYRDGFVTLPERYNFVLITTPSPITIREGRFLDERGEPIPVVHNAGRYDFARSVDNFGYGPDRNRLKPWTHWGMRAFYRTLNWLTRPWT